jgi:hypothetical protein
MDAIASNPLSLTQDERRKYAIHVKFEIGHSLREAFQDLPIACTIVCFGDPSRLRRNYGPIWRALVALYVQTTNPLRTYEDVPVAERQAVLTDLHRAVEPYKRDPLVSSVLYNITDSPHEWVRRYRKENGIWVIDRFPVARWLENQRWLEPRLERLEL